LTKRTLAVFSAIAGVLLFSTKAIFAKVLYSYGVDHLSTLMLRMAFATPAYLVILSIIKKPSLPIAKKDHFWLFLLGFLGYYLASYLDFKGLTYIKASLERLILFIYPTLVVILSSLVLKKRISNIQKAGVLITYIGIVVVFFPELVRANDQNEQVLTGAMLVFFSAFTFAGYLIGSQWLIPKFGAKRFTAMAMIWSGIFVTVHYLSTASDPSSILLLSPRVYLIGAAMGIVSTILPSFLISHAIYQLGAAQFSIFGSIGPVSTITLAYIFLGERLTFIQIMGSLIVILGVIIAEYFTKRSSTTSP
jgi:drug/metabolite transporter (DMT)-like permease